jgi:hypothetical protein
MTTPSADPPPPPPPDPLAVALARLDPAPHGLPWHALMFHAGRESKARALRFWRAAAGACAVVACGFAAAYFTRPVVVVERVVTVERPPAHAAPPPPAPAPVGAPVAAPVPKPATVRVPK